MKKLFMYLITFSLISTGLNYAVDGGDLTFGDFDDITDEVIAPEITPTKETAQFFRRGRRRTSSPPLLSQSITKIVNNAQRETDPRKALHDLQALKDIPIYSLRIFPLKKQLIILSAKFELLEKNIKKTDCATNIASNINANLDSVIEKLKDIKDSGARQRLTNAFNLIKTTFNNKIKNSIE